MKPMKAPKAAATAGDLTKFQPLRANRTANPGLRAIVPPNKPGHFACCLRAEAPQHAALDLPSLIAVNEPREGHPPSYVTGQRLPQRRRLGAVQCSCSLCTLKNRS